MCSDCGIIIEIKGTYKSNKKYDKALDILEKALGYSSASEVSPYRSVRQLVRSSKQQVEKRLLDVHNAIVTGWLGLSKAVTPFKLSGKVYINPKTGKPLTKATWASIKKELARAFGYVYAGQDALITATALSLGRIISSKTAKKAASISLGSANPGGGLRILDTDPQYRAAATFADQYAAENIVELTNRQFKAIHDTVLNAQVNRMGTRELETDLFDKFGAMNRDWRRIAETEIANSVNNGVLITELQKDRPEGDYVYMEGVSAATACPWCAEKINNQVVVLLDQPPTGGGDQIQINGKMFTAIWPGKNNVGRKRADWWIAAGTQHPHCMCSWLRYEPGYEDARKVLDDAIEAAIEETKRGIVPEYLG